MKVLLLKPLHRKGSPGDVVEVKDGFARNYLLPQGIAIPYDEKKAKEIAHLRHISQRRKEKYLRTLSNLCEKIKGVSLHLEERTHDGGILYGSLTNRRIAQLLTEKVGEFVDPRWIVLETPLKTAGEHKVVVAPNPQIQVEVTVKISSLTETLSTSQVPPAQTQSSQE